MNSAQAAKADLYQDRCCFAATLDQHGLSLLRGKNNTLQVNIGFLCNQACKHCHLEAGPLRREVMSRHTMDQVIGFARKSNFQVIDITGGAPELVTDIEYLVESLAPFTGKLYFRSNLTALLEKDKAGLLELLTKLKVTIISSFPSTNAGQTDSQRGKGVLEKSIRMLQKLNDIGYGKDGTGLELHLVSNPAGAFMPVSQCQAEKKFKQEMARKWSISFNNLYTFANMPLGRFKNWLIASENFDQYMKRLSDAFNPATVENLMCKNLVSVSWDGYLYDCDFNQAAGLGLGNAKKHITDTTETLREGLPIAMGDHCYACTAGAGFT